MPGMLMSDRIRISEGSRDLGGARQRRRRRRRELHREAAGAQIAPELLAEQGFDIGLVIDDEDVNAQFCASSLCLRRRRLAAA